MASTSNVLQKQHKVLTTAKDMMHNLHDLSGKPSRSARISTMKKLMNTKMEADTSVRDHVLKMISYINELETLGAEIDAILSSLLIHLFLTFI